MVVLREPGRAEHSLSVEDTASEDDPIADMLEPNHRTTCLSPLPLLHWLYLHIVVDEKYVPHYQHGAMGGQPPEPNLPRSA